jgi:hypothetical protein
MGNRSPVVRAFWALIHREIQEDMFLQELKTESEHHAANSRQGHMLEFLETNLEHFSPVRVVVDTPEKVSSPVEGFFGHYKNPPDMKCYHWSMRWKESAFSLTWLLLEDLVFGFPGFHLRFSRTRSEQAWNIRRHDTSR